MKQLIHLFALLLAFPAFGAVTLNLYVDSDYTGEQDGSAEHPYKYLSDLAWVSINSALQTRPVTIYFSAREAGTDTNDFYVDPGDPAHVYGGIYVPGKKNTNYFSFLLTLDGHSYYNTNDETPGWVAYAGNSHCVISRITTQNAQHRKYSNIRVTGFRIHCIHDAKPVGIAGDDWTLDHCEVSQGYTTSQPGVNLIPTSDQTAPDKLFEGSSEWVVPCVNINIISNIIHNTGGECIYLGGGGTGRGVPPGPGNSGFPSHTNINVIGNICYECGSVAGQGDAIDGKAGLINVVLRGNIITNLHYGSGIRGIVFQGQLAGTTGTNLIIDGNYISDVRLTESGAIAVVENWGTPQGTFIMNNLVVSNSGGGDGIRIDAAMDTSYVFNNTVIGCSNYGISVYGSAVIKNNVCISNALYSDQKQFAYTPGQADLDYNAYSQIHGGETIGLHSTNLTTSDVQGAFVNYGTDFHLTAGSVLRNAGLAQSFFLTDFDGVFRGTNWDIGAFEYPSGEVAPVSLPYINVLNATTISLDTIIRP